MFSEKHWFRYSLSKHGEKTVGVRRVNKLMQQKDIFEHEVLSVQNTIRAMFLFWSSEFLHGGALRINTIEELLPQAPVVKKAKKR